MHKYSTVFAILQQINEKDMFNAKAIFTLEESHEHRDIGNAGKKDAISVAVGGKAVTNATFPKQSW